MDLKITKYDFKWMCTHVIGPNGNIVTKSVFSTLLDLQIVVSRPFFFFLIPFIYIILYNVSMILISPSRYINTSVFKFIYIIRFVHVLLYKYILIHSPL